MLVPEPLPALNPGWAVQRRSPAARPARRRFPPETTQSTHNASPDITPSRIGVSLSVGWQSICSVLLVHHPAETAQRRPWKGLAANHHLQPPLYTATCACIVLPEARPKTTWFNVLLPCQLRPSGMPSCLTELESFPDAIQAQGNRPGQRHQVYPAPQTMISLNSDRQDKTHVGPDGPFLPPVWWRNSWG